MPAHDQLELIAPSGEIKFYDLSPAKGITNIGRHPENDIVIDNPAVAQFHAVLDHRQRPFQLVVVTQDNPTSISGEPVLPNVPHTLHTWDTIELNGHSLVLVEGGDFADTRPEPRPAPVERPASAATPAVAGAALAGAAAASAASAAMVPAPAPQTMPAGPFVRLASLPADRLDETIVTEITVREWIVDVDQPATTQITIVNGGDLVATFNVHVEGINPAWVSVEPPQINLFEGERATVTVDTIIPPRRPDTHAGTSYLSFVVTSPDYPGRVSAQGGSITVNPYYDFTVTDVSPRQQTVTWGRPMARASYAVANRGNSECAYRVDGDDDERACRFEFRLPGEQAALISHAELRLGPDTAVNIPLIITPHKRRFFGVGKHNYMCTVTTTPLSGIQTPRTVLAQVASAPLIGPWVIILGVILLAILVAIIFKPRIRYFGTDPAFLARDTTAPHIKAGDPITLYWRTSPFTSLRIESSIPQDPEAGTVPGPTNGKTFKPIENVTYRLRAENLLTSLSSSLFGATWDIPVEVEGIRPGIIFTGTTSTGSVNPETRTISIVQGQSVTLLWTVVRTDELRLLTNDAPQTIAPEQYTGSLVVQPETTTTYKLVAINHYAPAGDISEPITVRVSPPPTATPPTPVIERFDVQPTVITVGKSVKLDWVVTGVNKITIDNVQGELSPTGSIEVVPDKAGTIFYKLTATNGGAPVILQRQVTVQEAPTATPEPLVPNIEYFTVTPAEVVAGSPQAAGVLVAWSITGDTTNIKISGPDFGEVANLSRQGTITVAVTTPTLFVLTAFNGEKLSVSRTAQVNVLLPTPTGTPPPTATPAPTPLPLPIVIFSAIADPDHNEPPGNVFQITTSDVPSNTRRYSVVAGTWVKFSWTTTNAVKTVFNQADKAPADAVSMQINSANTYLFSAINAQNISVDTFIQVVTTPRQPPPPPSNVSGTFTNPSGPAIIFWSYSSSQLYLIDYFKVYRVSLPGIDFVPVASNIAKDVLPYQWSDTAATCDMAYYIVAVYTDPDGIQKETGPSTTSWYSPTCPTPTPPP